MESEGGADISERGVRHAGSPIKAGVLRPNLGRKKLSHKGRKKLNPKGRKKLNPEGRTKLNRKDARK